MRKLRSIATTVAVASLVAFAFNSAVAQQFLPSEADIEALVVTDFSGGASTSSINSIDTAGDGIELDITWDNTGEGFSRVVLQRESFDTDLSTFSGLDLIFQTDDSGIGVQTFVQTGDGFSFTQSAFINISPGAPQVVSLDFATAGTTDTNNVRQFGFQLFGPDSGPATVRVLGVPEPSALALLAAGCATLLGWRRRIFFLVGAAYFAAAQLARSELCGDAGELQSHAMKN